MLGRFMFEPCHMDEVEFHAPPRESKSKRWLSFHPFSGFFYVAHDMGMVAFPTCQVGTFGFQQQWISTAVATPGPGHMPERMSDRMPTRMPDRMRDRMSKYVSDRLADQIDC